MKPLVITGNRWRQQSRGSFRTAPDEVRDLLVVDHPWIPSRAGNFGQWQTTVPAPAGWAPGRPLYVSFYQSDNYSGSWLEHTWLGAQVFVGHRFKQLLVNGQLVWEQDVADDEQIDVVDRTPAKVVAGAGFRNGYRVVDISRAAAQKLTLTFRVTDKVASTTKLPGDAYRRFSWSKWDPHQAAKNFHTTVYFGDIYLSPGPDPVRPPAKSLARSTPFRAGQKFPRAGVPLTLVAPGNLPAAGFPVRCGVPVPRGSAAAGTSFSLLDPQGRPVPLASRELSHWPDGTLRWLLCEFVARRGGRYRLVRGRRARRPDYPVRVRRAGRGVTVQNGRLTVRFGSPGSAEVIREIKLRDGIALGPMTFGIKLNRVGWRDEYVSRVSRVTVEQAGDVCTVVRVDGRMLRADGQRFGSFRARIHLWEGLPYLLAEWRLVNESDQAMAVLVDWSARVRLPGLADGVVDFGPCQRGYDRDDIAVKSMGHYGTFGEPRRIPLYADSETSCRQEQERQARLYRNTQWVATAEQAAGFANLNNPRGGVVGAMRWFAEEFPKGFVVRPDLLALATVPEYDNGMQWPHDRPTVRIGRGEAKRQTFALWLHDGRLPGREAERFAACLHDPPHLFDRSWFIGSGALEAGPAREHPALAGWKKNLTGSIDWTGIGAPRPGHREYWDTCWSNDYRGRAHVGLLQYVETGDPRWRRYFEAACTHNRDVDIVHFCPEHPEWVGAVHEYGQDHTAAGVMHNIGLNVDSLLEHYLVTGDPDSREAAAGIAERMLDLDTWVRSAREVGWPLAQVIRWYDQTGDRRFLRKAQELMAAVRAYVEPRRGVFAEIHGSANYPGVVPFMTGYLAFGLIRYHRVTGDHGALQLLDQITAGLFAEGQNGPGRFRYSPFPELNVSATARTVAWNALAGGPAGYLYLVTGQPRHQAWARLCYDALVRERKRIRTTMDMIQTAGWMLHAVAARRPSRTA